MRIIRPTCCRMRSYFLGRASRRSTPGLFKFSKGTQIQKAGKKKMFKIIDKALNVLLISTFSALTALILLITFGKRYNFKGPSMEPNFSSGEEYYFFRYFCSTIRRFSVVSFKTGVNSFIYAKRIIGLPNERIQIKRGKVYINGQLLQQPFEIINANGGDLEEVTVPKNHYFLLGDNRRNSKDSRIFGCVHEDYISGALAFKIPW